MTPSLLRCLWQVIEEAPSHYLLALDEASLTDWLVSQIDRQQLLQNAEKDAIAAYLQSHRPLIREIVENHRHTHCPLGA